MSNVISLCERRSAKTVAPIRSVPQGIEGPINAIVQWARENDIDVEQPAFIIRLADFTALLRTQLKETRTA